MCYYKYVYKYLLLSAAAHSDGELSPAALNTGGQRRIAGKSSLKVFIQSFQGKQLGGKTVCRKRSNIMRWSCFLIYTRLLKRFFKCEICPLTFPKRYVFLTASVVYFTSRRHMAGFIMAGMDVIFYLCRQVYFCFDIHVIHGLNVSLCAARPVKAVSHVEQLNGRSEHIVQQQFWKISPLES